MAFSWLLWGADGARNHASRARQRLVQTVDDLLRPPLGSLLGRKLLEYVPEFAVELVRLLQHRVMADTFDGDRTEVGVLLVGLDDCAGEGLRPAVGVDAPHDHPALLQHPPR